MYIVIGIIVIAVLFIFIRYGSMDYSYKNHQAHGRNIDINKADKDR